MRQFFITDSTATKQQGLKKTLLNFIFSNQYVTKIYSAMTSLCPPTSAKMQPPPPYPSWRWDEGEGGQGSGFHSISEELGVKREKKKKI